MVVDDTLLMMTLYLNLPLVLSPFMIYLLSSLKVWPDQQKKVFIPAFYNICKARECFQGPPLFHCLVLLGTLKMAATIVIEIKIP